MLKHVIEIGHDHFPPFHPTQCDRKNASGKESRNKLQKQPHSCKAVLSTADTTECPGGRKPSLRFDVNRDVLCNDECNEISKAFAFYGLIYYSSPTAWLTRFIVS